ncbi:MAG: hypothetical protein R3Y49_06975 [Rikenellaceae bacterium]
MKRKLQIMLLAFVSLFMFSSCEESTITSGYKYGFDISQASFTEITTVTNYLTGKGFQFSDFIFYTSSSEATNNSTAVAQFNSLASNIAQSHQNLFFYIHFYLLNCCGVNF